MSDSKDSFRKEKDEVSRPEGFFEKIDAILDSFFERVLPWTRYNCWYSAFKERSFMFFSKPKSYEASLVFFVNLPLSGSGILPEKEPPKTFVASVSRRVSIPFQPVVG